jgi:ER lumen protein retaining receptor
MNIFRLAGDMTHLLSFVVLLLRLYGYKSAAGISAKTQQMFLIVFITRYLDLFTNFVSLYNTVMKVLYITLSALIVYMIGNVEPWKSTNDPTHDSFQHYKFAVAPCLVMALVFNEGYTPLEILWAFSIYLEALAILPQLIVLQRFGEVENLTGNYIFMLGLYRALYIANWIYRAKTEPHYHTHLITIISGVVQTALYVDFFYHYATSEMLGKKIELPST